MRWRPRREGHEGRSGSVRSSSVGSVPRCVHLPARGRTVRQPSSTSLIMLTIVCDNKPGRMLPERMRSQPEVMARQN